MTISEDANAAADYIEEHGWIQNVQRSWNGGVCLVGAIRKSKELEIISSIDIHPFERDVREAIGEYVGTPAAAIWDWNDQPERTQEEVIQMLRDVAIKHAPDEMRSNG